MLTFYIQPAAFAAFLLRIAANGFALSHPETKNTQEHARMVLQRMGHPYLSTHGRPSLQHTEASFSPPFIDTSSDRVRVHFEVGGTRMPYWYNAEQPTYHWQMKGTIDSETCDYHYILRPLSRMQTCSHMRQSPEDVYAWVPLATSPALATIRIE